MQNGHENKNILVKMLNKRSNDQRSIRQFLKFVYKRNQSLNRECIREQQKRKQLGLKLPSVRRQSISPKRPPPKLRKAPRLNKPVYQLGQEQPKAIVLEPECYSTPQIKGYPQKQSSRKTVALSIYTDLKRNLSVQQTGERQYKRYKLSLANLNGWELEKEEEINQFDI